MVSVKGLVSAAEVKKESKIIGFNIALDGVRDGSGKTACVIRECSQSNFAICLGDVFANTQKIAGNCFAAFDCCLEAGFL